MNPFSSLTIWIVLATIVLGLITIACIFIILNWVFPNYSIDYTSLDNWCGFSIFAAILIITQVCGLALESILIKYFPKEIKGINVKDSKFEEINIDAEKEYEYMYCVISSFTDDDDKHGHIQRIIGQFFLTFNSLVSYLIGFFTVIGLLIYNKGVFTDTIIVFLLIMILLFLLTLYVAKIRYCSMIKSIWTIRNIIADRNKKNDKL